MDGAGGGWWMWQLGSSGEQPVAVQDTMEQGAGQTPGTPWMELDVAGDWAGREI